MFTSTPIKEVLEVLRVNIFPQTFLSYYMIPRMKLRDTKSLIINLSSTGAHIPVPGLSVYGATKAYNDYLSKVHSIEYGDFIDILSLRPGYTSTPGTNNMPPDCCNTI
jgi:short-subunit dehydrogenase